MSEIPPPLAPLDDLDYAFNLPDYITDPGLKRLYEVLLVRMRKEAQHLDMNTVQLLLIERIAFNYVMLRHLEATNGFAKASEQKDFNTFWLSMTAEFNKNLRNTDAESRDRVIMAMASVVNRVISQVDDEQARVKLRTNLADELEQAGF